MIHYRTSDNKNTYRSIKQCSKKETGQVYAFASRQDALKWNNPLKCVWNEPPIEITESILSSFIDAHEAAKSERYPPKSAGQRRALESKHCMYLFGFYKGNAIRAHQSMSVSAKWVRYSCPVLINDRNTIVSTLENL